MTKEFNLINEKMDEMNLNEMEKTNLAIELASAYINSLRHQLDYQDEEDYKKLKKLDKAEAKLRGAKNLFNGAI